MSVLKKMEVVLKNTPGQSASGRSHACCRTQRQQLKWYDNTTTRRDEHDDVCYSLDTGRDDELAVVVNSEHSH